LKALIALWPATAVAAACGAVSAPEVGDPARGQVAYQKCYSCHALEPGRNDLGGPTLHKIVGRRVAAEASFDYSPAMRRFAQQQPRWTADLLDQLIADPEALAPGTSMTFHGISDAAERRDLIVYLERGGGDRTP
jgi:cytochrome c